VLIGAGAVAAVIAVVVVLIVVFTGGGTSTPKGVPKVGSIAAGLPGSREVDADFKGIPQKGMVLGSDVAKVTMVEYIDLQCPFCQQFDTQVLPAVIKQYVKTGKVKVELRVLDFIGPDSSRGRKAMIAAGNQNRAFNYAQILYFNQGTENTGWLSENMVASAAASIPGLDVTKLLARPQLLRRQEDRLQRRRASGDRQGVVNADAARRAGRDEAEARLAPVVDRPGLPRRRARHRARRLADPRGRYSPCGNA